MNNYNNYYDAFHTTGKGEVYTNYYDPFYVKHRRRTTKAQLKILERAFEVNMRPDASMRKKLGEELGMTPRSVQVWFQNRRAKIKKNMQSNKTAVSDGLKLQSSTNNTLVSQVNVGNPPSYSYRYDNFVSPKSASFVPDAYRRPVDDYSNIRSNYAMRYDNLNGFPKYKIDYQGNNWSGYENVRYHSGFTNHIDSYTNFNNENMYNTPVSPPHLNSMKYQSDQDYYKYSNINLEYTKPLVLSDNDEAQFKKKYEQRE